MLSHHCFDGLRGRPGDQTRTNAFADLRPLVPNLLSAVETTSPGVAEFIGQS